MNYNDEDGSNAKASREAQIGLTGLLFFLGNIPVGEYTMVKEEFNAVQDQIIFGDGKELGLENYINFI